MRPQCLDRGAVQLVLVTLATPALAEGEDTSNGVNPAPERLLSGFAALDRPHGIIEGGAGILRVRPTGSPVEPVYAVSAERHEIGAEFLNALPGGGLLYRLRYAGNGQDEFQIAAMKVPGGSPKLLTRGVFARYAPGGHLLVVTADGKLIALPFDAARLEVTGPPNALLEGVGVRAAGFSIDLAL